MFRYPNRFFFLLIIILAIPFISRAQSDTLSIDAGQGKDIFLRQNLALLAAQYNIDIAHAQAEQARRWDNPTLNTDQTLYDGRFFRHDKVAGQSYGQVYIQLQQLIRTAGKIRKQTLIARDNESVAEAQFNELMRDLIYQLTTDINNLGQLQGSNLVLNNELASLQSLSNGMDQLFKAGDVSKKEDLRIKALLFSLQNDIHDNLDQQIPFEEELQTLLNLKPGVWVKIATSKPLPSSQINQLSLASLEDSAGTKRPDLQTLRAQQQLLNHSIDYQKALSHPDLTVGLEYDRLNSYVPNYYGLGLSLPLPIFNRNRGNIQAAQFSAKQNSLLLEQMQKKVSSDLWAAWEKLGNATRLLEYDQGFLHNNYEGLMQNMISSYKERQVGLIEFLDFFESYKETRLRENMLVNAQRNAAAELNYASNQEILKL